MALGTVVVFRIVETDFDGDLGIGSGFNEIEDSIFGFCKVSLGFSVAAVTLSLEVS